MFQSEYYKVHFLSFEVHFDLLYEAIGFVCLVIVSNSLQITYDFFPCALFPVFPVTILKHHH